MDNVNPQNTDLSQQPDAAEQDMFAGGVDDGVTIINPPSDGAADDDGNAHSNEYAGESPKRRYSRKQNDAGNAQKQSDANKHFSFTCSKDITDKIRQIAANDGFTVKQVLEFMLTKGIAAYEAKHGKIRIKKKDINDLF